MNDLFIFIEGKHDKIFVDYVLADYLSKEKSIIAYPIPYAKKILQELIGILNLNQTTIYFYLIWIGMKLHALPLKKS